VRGRVSRPGPRELRWGKLASQGLLLQPPPSTGRALLYGSLCMAADSCGVMGMLWGQVACVHVSCGPARGAPGG
jgi:hypothetical protein